MTFFWVSFDCFWFDSSKTLGLNRLTGDLNPTFCQAPTSNAMTILRADCAGDFPEVQCDCCTTCFDRDGVCYPRRITGYDTSC